MGIYRQHDMCITISFLNIFINKYTHDLDAAVWYTIPGGGYTTVYHTTKHSKINRADTERLATGNICIYINHIDNTIVIETIKWLKSKTILFKDMRRMVCGSNFMSLPQLAVGELCRSIWNQLPLLPRNFLGTHIRLGGIGSVGKWKSESSSGRVFLIPRLAGENDKT